jgi:large subunit ribosomal protein L21
MYAIIEDSGTQIKVSEGDVIRVASRELPAEAGTLTFDKVLLVGGLGEGKEAKIGAPLLSGAKVTADVLGEGKTDKVEIFKFRRRKNYRRHRGHRQDFIQVKITGITA